MTLKKYLSAINSRRQQELAIAVGKQLSYLKQLATREHIPMRLAAELHVATNGRCHFRHNAKPSDIALMDQIFRKNVPEIVVSTRRAAF